MEANRVELKDYNFVFAIVRLFSCSDNRGIVLGKITECKSASFLEGAPIYIKPRENTVSEVVDLNTIDLSKFNRATGEWEGGNIPTAVPFKTQLFENTHPLCFVPEKYRCADWFASYIAAEIEEERRNIERTTATLNSLSSNTIYKKLVTYTDSYDRSIDTGDMRMFHRFQLVEEILVKVFSTEAFNRLLELVNYFVGSSVFNYHHDFISSYISTCKLISGIQPPVISKEDKKKVIKKANRYWRPRNCWNYDPPNEVEFEDNTEMLEKVKQHLSMIKGLEITYLRKRMLAYYSDGAFVTSPDAAPKGYHPPFLISHVSDPLLYSGEVWALHFNISSKDYQRDNFIYFCTPEQYVNAMTSMGRPDLVKDWKPWSDLIFVSSDWCERNSKSRYGDEDEIDLSTPNRRRLSLATWILGPFTQKCIEDGLGNPLEGFATITSPKLNKNKWRYIAETKKTLSSAGAS
jgi:hypothetical protein